MSSIVDSHGLCRAPGTSSSSWLSRCPPPPLPPQTRPSRCLGERPNSLARRPDFANVAGHLTGKTPSTGLVPDVGDAFAVLGAAFLGGSSSGTPVPAPDWQSRSITHAPFQPLIFPNPLSLVVAIHPSTSRGTSREGQAQAGAHPWPAYMVHKHAPSHLPRPRPSSQATGMANRARLQSGIVNRDGG
jgi:hypothetical protein